jgi:hypothetical protein
VLQERFRVGDERDDVAAELVRVRDDSRAAIAASSAPTGGAPGPASPLARETVARPVEAPAPEEAWPSPPDATQVNEAWAAAGSPRRGLVGLLERVALRLLGGHVQAQRAWSAHQVRLDNEILRYAERRFAATHRHYDRLLGQMGRRQDEIDERHALLERELIAHVQDLARRIDVVLAESTRGRGGQDLALADLRARILRLEEALRRQA